MVNIAVPYTQLFKERPDAFLTLSDAVELKWSEDIEFSISQPKIFHWSEGIVDDLFFDKLYQQNLPEYFAKYDIRYFSFDLGPGCRAIRMRHILNGDLFFPASPSVTIDELQHLFEDKIRKIRSFFTGDLAVELMNYYPTGAYETVCEPAVISEIVRSQDTYLLVDIGHAQVTSFYLGMSLAEYLEALPVEKVKHVHLSKCGFLKSWDLPDTFRRDYANILSVFPEEFSYDAHECPGAHEMEHALQILRKSQVDDTYVTIEYYKNTDRLLNSYRELIALCRKYSDL